MILHLASRKLSRAARSTTLSLLLAALGGAVPGRAADLMLWAKSDAITDRKSGDPVEIWKDSSGRGNDLRSGVEKTTAPTFLETGANGRPAVLFSGDATETPMVVNALGSSLEGEWKGATVILVGSNLGKSSGWFDTGGMGALRAYGPVQHCGSSNAFAGQLVDSPDHSKGPRLVSIDCGIDETGTTALSAYVNGKLIHSGSDPKGKYGVTFKNPVFGTYQTSIPHSGEIYEILVYRGVLTASDREKTERYLMAKYGIRPGDATAPQSPVGVPLPNEEAPAVTEALKPFEENLQLWAAADDLDESNPETVNEWPNRAGSKQPLKALPDRAPKFVRDSLNGRSVVSFSADPTAKPPTFQAMTLPLFGVWKEFTLVAVGRNLDSAWWFSTSNGYESVRGGLHFLQHTGAPSLSVGSLPIVGAGSKGELLGSVTIGKRKDEGQFSTLHRMGVRVGRVEDDSKVNNIVFDKPTIFEINNGITADLAELLVYNRALTDAERYQTERYLAEKYGLPLKSPDELASDPVPRSQWSFTERQLPREMSWLGNSESGKESWVQHGIFSHCGLPDGRIAAISVWDEDHKEIGLYKDGKSVPEIYGQRRGGISGGGGMIATDGKFFYAGMTPGTTGQAAPGAPTPPVGIRRLTLDLKEEPWPELPKGQIKIETTVPWQEIDGMAIIGNELFVTLQHAEGIRVFDVTTGAFKRDLKVAASGRLTADVSGMLWATTKDGAIQMDVNGKMTGREIHGVKVGGLAVNPKGQLLLADRGERQQVIIYDIREPQPKEVDTIGERGGILAAKGVMSDYRLLDPLGVSSDAEGNVTVSGGWRIMSYTPDGKFRWKAVCTHFCIVGDFDPATDGNDLYTRNFHYSHRPGKPPGEDWEWVGYTADTRRFPEMGEGNQHTIVRRLNGSLYRYTVREGQEGLIVSQKEKDSEFFIPCGVFQTSTTTPPESRLAAAPESGRYIWTDASGNGLAEKEEIATPAEDTPTEWSRCLFVDTMGGVWQPQGRAGLRYFPCNGFTESGAPIYRFEDQQTISRPPEFVEVIRANYYPESDTMYLSGHTWENQIVPGEWVTAGREVIRYDDWSKSTRRVSSRMPFPGKALISSWDVVPSRDLLFAGDTASSAVFVYDTKSGKRLGIIEPNADQVGLVGWLDFPGGALQTHEKKNGEILLSLEECLREKELIFRLPSGFEKSQGR